jgi:hypothetical protein
LTDFSHVNEVSGAGIDLLEILHRGEKVTVTFCSENYPDIDAGAAGSVDQSTWLRASSSQCGARTNMRFAPSSAIG